MKKSSLAVYSWDDFSGGIADYPSIAGRHTHADHSCIDLRSDPRGVRLSHALTRISGSSITSRVLTIVAVGDTPDSINPYLIAFCENGDIWRFKQDGTDWTNVYHDPDGIITGAIIASGRLWWATNTHLNSIAVTGSYGISANSWNTTSHINLSPYVQQTLAGSSVHPLLEIGGSLFIGDGNVVDVLTHATNTFTPNALTLDTGSRIIAMTYHGSSLHIYTINNGIAQTARKYVWNPRSSSTPDACIVMEGIPIAAVAPYGAGDFVFAGYGGDMGIYTAEGYGYRIVRRLGPLGYGSLSFNAGHMAYARDILPIIGTQDGRIRTFGSTVSRMGVICSPYRTSTGHVNDYTTSVGYSRDMFYFGVVSVATGGATTYGIDCEDMGDFVSSGYITSGPIGAESLSTEKALREITIVHDLPTGTSLAVSISRDGGAPVLVRTITATDAPYTRIYPTELGIGRDFVQCQVTVGLATTVPTATPVLRGVSVEYETGILS